MIILDTNAVSEPMKGGANARVEAWINRQMRRTLYATTTTLSEVLVGIELLPQGRRREQFAMASDAFIRDLFGRRILSFDEKAATAYAMLVERAQRKGYAIAVADGQIAAIAEVHGFAVATLDVEPFVAAGVAVINPWEEE